MGTPIDPSLSQQCRSCSKTRRYVLEMDSPFVHHLMRCSQQIPEAEKLRLVMLFALRYERDGRPQVNELLALVGGDSSRNTVRNFLGVAEVFAHDLTKHLAGDCEWSTHHGERNKTHG